MNYQNDRIERSMAVGDKASGTASGLRSVALGVLLTLSVNSMAETVMSRFTKPHKVLGRPRPSWLSVGGTESDVPKRCQASGCI